MNRLRPDWILRALLCGVLVVVATIGLRGAFDGWGFLIPASIGAAVGIGAATIGKRQQFLLGETLAISLVLFGIAGVFLGGISAPASFVDGLVNGWADLLSSSPPAQLTPTLRIVPFAIAWLGAALAGELLRRDSGPVVAAVGPVVALILTLLVSIEDRGLAVAQGATLAVGAVLLGFIAQLLGPLDLDGPVASAHTATSGTSRGRRQAFAMSAAMMLIVAIASTFLGPQMPLVGTRDRFDLRQYQDRPWDPLDEPSPLVTVKASLKEGQRERELFVVRSDTPVTRLNLATLSSYAGTVWTVADAEESSKSRFTPVDNQFPRSTTPTTDVVTYQLEILDSNQPWLPLSGWPSVVERLNSGASSERLRFNSATGTVADPTGLARGEVFQITASVSPEVSLAELGQLTAVSNAEDATELALVPPSLRNVAGDVFEGADAGTPRIVALSRSFVDNGFYDHTELARPGHSLARLDEFFADPDRLVGFSEQYAAGAAVLARIGGVPARVVVGYEIPPERYIDGEAIVIADDLNAWIEIETAEQGWVPVVVTPDRSREPEQDTVGRSIQDVAIPNPPPPPAPPPEVQPPSQPEATEEESEDEADDDEPSTPLFGSYRWVAVASVGAVAPLVVLGISGLAIVGLKRRRRKRRSTTGDSRDQVAGAWRELCDRFTEIGIDPHSTTTPTEIASATLAVLEDRETIGVPVRRLARAVDRAAFHPTEPDNDAVAEAWDDYREAASCLNGSRSRKARALSASDPRPLRRRSAQRGPRRDQTKDLTRVR